MVKTMKDSPLNDIKFGKITSEWAKARGLVSFYKDSIPSTNDRAKEEAFKEDLLDQNVVLYLAEHQSKGRGRNKNHWQDTQHGSLLSSWSFYLQDVPVPVCSPRAGLALFKAASSTWPFLPWSLKAPNDLYLGEKKVAGLLLETLTQGDEVRFIVGLGFNITSHPENIESATHLMAHLPVGVPLLGDDFISFLDRFFFELSGVVERSLDNLSPSESATLVYTLNLRPGLEEKYVSVSSDGTIQTTEGTIPWASI